MIRLVIDPNIIASVLLGGLTRGRYRWLLDNLTRFEICYSDLLTDEIERFENAPYFQEKGVSEEEIRGFLDTFKTFSVKILVTSRVKQGRDRNDFYLISLCQDARAEFLITGDPELLEIKQLRERGDHFLERFRGAIVIKRGRLCTCLPPVCFHSSPSRNSGGSTSRSGRPHTRAMVL